MPEWTAEQLAQSAFDRNLIDENHLRELWGELGSRQVDPDEFKQLLLRRELVTSYQLERLLRGDRNGYFYGPYKVQYQIGSGTFARVFRAVHQHTGQVRAVKVLRQRFAGDPARREQFCREGEMGCSLRHPNIVPIYEIVSDRAQSYMVMEFLEGRNLREFVKVRKSVEPLQATKLAIDVCRGLDYAFVRGVSHRDLKASNVLVASNAQAKLVDFGLAGADPELSDAELAKIENPRTIDYAALERVTGVRKDDSRSDIFFLGCIYYYMLCGESALEETRDRIARLSRQRFESIVPIIKRLPDLPKDMAVVVGKSIELEPKQRYQTPAEFLNDLLLVAEHMAGGGNGTPRALGSPPVKQRTLMLVEPNPQLQETLRSQLRAHNYRVLVTADPQRPASLFTELHQPADCVIFSSGSLNEDALNAFNEFGMMAFTKNVPALLLLGARHNDWATKARTGPQRITISTPIKMKQLLAELEKVLNG